MVCDTDPLRQTGVIVEDAPPANKMCKIMKMLKWGLLVGAVLIVIAFVTYRAWKKKKAAADHKKRLAKIARTGADEDDAASLSTTRSDSRASQLPSSPTPAPTPAPTPTPVPNPAVHSQTRPLQSHPSSTQQNPLTSTTGLHQDQLCHIGDPSCHPPQDVNTFNFLRQSLSQAPAMYSMPTGPAFQYKPNLIPVSILNTNTSHGEPTYVSRPAVRPMFSSQPHPPSPPPPSPLPPSPLPPPTPRVKIAPLPPPSQTQQAAANSRTDPIITTSVEVEEHVDPNFTMI
jgi:hypothetical protein